MSEGHDNSIRGAVGDADELQIRIDIERYTEYRGTRSQLEAEGVIPVNFEWPLGKKCVKWTANGLNFDLWRTKRNGVKGPAKQWVEGDYWMLRFSPSGVSWDSEQIRLKTRELNRAVYRQSYKGEKEFHATFSAFWDAQKDEKFQAFKRLLPALGGDKRRRLGKSVDRA